MSMVNVSLVGNLARSPEHISFASGKIKTVLVIAVNSGSQKSSGEKKAEAADFYRVEIWGKLAELAQKYLNKGNQVGVCGRLIMEHWKDKDGHVRLTPVVSATQLSFPPRTAAVRDFDRQAEQQQEVPVQADDAECDQSELIDDDLFAGARAVTVAEPPAQYYIGSSPYRTHRAAVARR